MLEPYMFAPSKMRKHLFPELAEKINGIYHLTTEFLTFGMLSKSDPLELELYNHLTKRISLPYLIEKHALTTEFVESLQSDINREALGRFCDTAWLWLNGRQDRELANSAFAIYCQNKDEWEDLADYRVQYWANVFFETDKYLDVAKTRLVEYEAWLESKHMDKVAADRLRQATYVSPRNLRCLLDGDFGDISDWWSLYLSTPE